MLKCPLEHITSVLNHDNNTDLEEFTVDCMQIPVLSYNKNNRHAGASIFSHFT